MESLRIGEPLKLWSAERPWEAFQEMEREMATMINRLDRIPEAKTTEVKVA